MEDFMLEYLESLRQIECFLDPNPDPDDQALIRQLTVNSKEVRRIRQHNDRILSRKVFPLLKDPKSISDSQAAALLEFTAQLTSDPFLAYRIHQALLVHARQSNSPDILIPQLYRTGIACYTIYSAPAFRHLDRRLYGYFEEGASYLDFYDQIPSSETRQYLHRCLGNQVVACDVDASFEQYILHMDLIRDELDLWNDPYFRRQNPEIPWDRYILSAHQHRSSMLSVLRTPESHPDHYDVTPLHRQEIEDSCTYIYRHYLRRLQQSSILVPLRWQYNYYMALFHNGKISITELLDRLNALYNLSDPSDYSQEGMCANLSLPVRLLFYLQTFLAPGQVYPKQDELRTVLVRNIIQYISRCNAAGLLVQNVMDILPLYHPSSDMKDYLDLLLQFIITQHIPTYIHSVVSAKLTRFLTGVMLQKSPERLCGLCAAMTPEEVLHKQKEILTFSYECSLCHDIGSCFTRNISDTYSRSLFPEEMLLIQEHTRIGYRSLSLHERTRPFQDAALGHHKWYNNAGGYPEEFDMSASPLRPLLSILSVCDSLEAATDQWDRKYASPLTLDEILSEMETGRETRYAGYVLDLLRQKPVLEEIQKILYEERLPVYYAAYRKK